MLRRAAARAGERQGDAHGALREMAESNKSLQLLKLAGAKVVDLDCESRHGQMLLET